MILVNVEEFDKERLYLLTHKIKLNKEEYIEFTPEDRDWTGVDTDHTNMTMKGRRYNDDERIARMVVGEIYGKCNFNLEEAKKMFLALSSTEMEPIIKYCVNDAAESDYWYTYEKEW